MRSVFILFGTSINKLAIESYKKHILNNIDCVYCLYLNGTNDIEVLDSLNVINSKIISNIDIQNIPSSEFNNIYIYFFLIKSALALIDDLNIYDNYIFCHMDIYLNHAFELNSNKMNYLKFTNNDLSTKLLLCNKYISLELSKIYDYMVTQSTDFFKATSLDTISGVFDYYIDKNCIPIYIIKSTGISLSYEKCSELQDYKSLTNNKNKLSNILKAQYTSLHDINDLNYIRYVSTYCIENKLYNDAIYFLNKAITIKYDKQINIDLITTYFENKYYVETITGIEKYCNNNNDIIPLIDLYKRIVENPPTDTNSIFYKLFEYIFIKISKTLKKSDSAINIIIQGSLNTISLENIHNYTKYGTVIISCFTTDNLLLLKNFIFHGKIKIKLVNKPEVTYQLYLPNINYYYSNYLIYKTVLDINSKYIIILRSDESFVDITKIVNKLDLGKLIISNKYVSNDIPFQLSDNIIAGNNKHITNMYGSVLKMNYRMIQVRQISKSYGVSSDFQTNQQILSINYLYSNKIELGNLDWREIVNNNYIIIECSDMGNFSLSYDLMPNNNIKSKEDILYKCCCPNITVNDTDTYYNKSFNMYKNLQKLIILNKYTDFIDLAHEYINMASKEDTRVGHICLDMAYCYNIKNDFKNAYKVQKKTLLYLEYFTSTNKINIYNNLIVIGQKIKNTNKNDIITYCKAFLELNPEDKNVIDILQKYNK